MPKTREASLARTNSGRIRDRLDFTCSLFSSQLLNILRTHLLPPQYRQDVSHLWKSGKVHIRHHAITDIPGAESKVQQQFLLETTKLTRRRAFSTIRRTPTTTISRSLTPLQATVARSPVSNLARGFSCLSIMSQPRLPPLSVTSTGTSILAAPSIQTRSFSASATLSAPRRTFNPSRRVQKRRHGFLARMRDKKGQQTIKRRQLKGRKYLSW